MTTQKGFLLSYIKYGDTNAIIHCFTLENGYQTFYLRGIYTSRNKKKAYLLPLNELCFTISSQNRGSLQSISTLELQKQRTLYEDIKSNSILFFIADFLNQIVRNENSSATIYFEILQFLDQLEAKNYQSHLVFLFKILENQGLLPLLDEKKHLNPETGTFTDFKTPLCFDEELSSIWKSLLSQENPYDVKIPSRIRKSFLDQILLYYQFHFSDFKIPTSLEILQQLF